MRVDDITGPLVADAGDAWSLLPIVYRPFDAVLSKLFLRKRMLTKKRPHLSGRVTAATIWPNHPLRLHGRTAGPLMTLSFDRVEHDSRVVNAAPVLKPSDIGRWRRFSRIRAAQVSARPTRHKVRNVETAVPAQPPPYKQRQRRNGRM